MPTVVGILHSIQFQFPGLFYNSPSASEEWLHFFSLITILQALEPQLVHEALSKY